MNPTIERPHYDYVKRGGRKLTYCETCIKVGAGAITSQTEKGGGFIGARTAKIAIITLPFFPRFFPWLVRFEEDAVVKMIRYSVMSVLPRFRVVVEGLPALVVSPHSLGSIYPFWPVINLAQFIRVIVSLWIESLNC